jgi:hypothetical protein
MALPQDPGSSISQGLSPLRHTGYYTFFRFNIQKFCVFSTHCSQFMGFVLFYIALTAWNFWWRRSEIEPPVSLESWSNKFRFVVWGIPSSTLWRVGQYDPRVHKYKILKYLHSDVYRPSVAHFRVQRTYSATKNIRFEMQKESISVLTGTVATYNSQGLFFILNGYQFSFQSCCGGRHWLSHPRSHTPPPYKH